MKKISSVKKNGLQHLVAYQTACDFRCNGNCGHCDCVAVHNSYQITFDQKATTREQQWGANYRLLSI